MHTATIESLEGRRLLASTISGTFFSDLDADGVRDSGEPGLRNQRVFIDLNFDGQFQVNEPSRITGLSGQYAFTGLTAGVFRLRVLLPTGFRQTAPSNKPFRDVVANGFDIHANTDFAATNTAMVRGTVYNDTNRDGFKQITEKGVAGVLVFLDSNRNGRLDAGERSRRTDANGNWRFDALAPGSYLVRVVPPKGVGVTSPTAFFKFTLRSGQVLSNRLLGLAT